MFDIQDVGTRFYTYVWLLYDCMVAAAAAGVMVVVLDRPNPVGGLLVEGPVLQVERHVSCLYVAPQPARHTLIACNRHIPYTTQSAPPIGLCGAQQRDWVRYSQRKIVSKSWEKVTSPKKL